MNWSPKASRQRFARVCNAFCGVDAPQLPPQPQLSPAQQQLFAAQDPRDQHHGLMVMQAMQQAHTNAPSWVLIAALLHDAGKHSRPYKPLERIAVGALGNRGLATLQRVGLVPKPLPAYPRLEGWKGALQQRLHHPQYAADWLLAHDTHPEAERIAQLIAEHHQPSSQWAQCLHALDVEF